MKTIFLGIFIFLSQSFFVYSQKEDVESITMYLISGTAKRKLPIRINNIKETYNYLFEKNYSDVFSDYEELIEIIESTDKIEAKEPSIFACVEITFEETQKMVSLFFKSNGQFYFEGNLYHKSDCLFYDFFHYFSDYIVPKSELKMKHIEIRCF